MILAFVDTETTGTNPDLHEVWEVAVIIEDTELRHAGRTNCVVDQYQARVPVMSLANADPYALEIGRYWDRPVTHPNVEEVASLVARMTRGATLASCNVAFDSAFLRSFLYCHGQPVTWHYSPIDVKSLVYGARPDLLGRKTDDLIRAVLEVEPDQRRHTAMRDAEIARQLFNAVMDR